jgi:hypothetical protein
MKKIKQHPWTSGVVLVAFVVLSSFAFMPGAHSFQVYLDSKMVADQYVTRDMVVPVLSIDPADRNNDIIVKYSECGRTVSQRTLTIKNAQDKVLKEWHFDGATAGFKDAMSIKVKDVVALKPNAGSSLKLIYTSNDFKAGQQVASLAIGKDPKASINGTR